MMSNFGRKMGDTCPCDSGLTEDSEDHPASDIPHPISIHAPVSG